jgi:GntR family transcriptional regulator/MocR family aminotransferase
LEDLRRAGVRVYPLELHVICKGHHQNKIFLGYGNLSCEEIEEGVRRIKSILGEE